MGGADSLPTSERRAAPGPSSLLRVSWVFHKAKMKIFLGLILFSLMLATCEGGCYGAPLLPESHEGKVVVPETCLDGSDGKRHLIGSTWKTAHCYKCNCQKNELSCCLRNGGVGRVLGCNTVRNPVTCKLEHYRLDDPTQRC